MHRNLISLVVLVFIGLVASGCLSADESSMKQWQKDADNGVDHGLRSAAKEAKSIDNAGTPLADRK